MKWAYIESFLWNYLQTTYFSIQLDEPTLTGNDVLLLAYVQFEIPEDLLFAKTLKTGTKAKSIFIVLGDFFKEKLFPFTYVISAATDGAPAMVGQYRGLISHLKEIIPDDFMMTSKSIWRYSDDGNTTMDHKSIS